MPLAIRVGIRHLHVEVERADVLAQRDEVLASHLLDLLELGPPALLLALALSPAAQPEEEEGHAEQQEQDGREPATSVAAVAARAAAGARIADPPDEVTEHGKGPARGVRLE